jgi:hypothetical protein
MMESNAPEKVDPAALIGVVVAAAITVVLTAGYYTLFSLAIGLTTLLILHGYYRGYTAQKRVGSSSWMDWAEWAFSAAHGICFVLILGVIIELISQNISLGDLFNPTVDKPSAVSDGVAFLIWFGGTVLVFAIRNWRRIIR